MWLGRMLSVTNTLQSIDLSSNKIGERGGVEIAKAVALTPPLHFLGLSNNRYALQLRWSFVLKK